MTWYAIRLQPGALRFPSKVVRMPNKIGGTSLKRFPSTVTLLESGLDEAGIEYFLPMEEKTVIHHRTKAEIRKRFPLVPGYAFVADVRDWPAIESVDGVAGAVRICGNPIRIPESSIMALRDAEEAINHENEAIWEARKAKRNPRAWKIGSRVMISRGHPMERFAGSIVAVTARKTVRMVTAFLGGQVEVEVPFDKVDLVA